jgi:carbonic anhydrase
MHIPANFSSSAMWRTSCRPTRPMARRAPSGQHGHAHRGGIRAYAERLKPLSPGDFIGKWIGLIAPAAPALGDRKRFAGDHEYHTALEQQAMVATLENLMRFPCVRTLVERGKLQLHAADFAVGTGRLSVRNPQSGVFAPLTGVEP